MDATQYLPLVKPDSSAYSETQTADSLRPIISLTGSTIHLPTTTTTTTTTITTTTGDKQQQQQDIFSFPMATLSTLNTRTMFQQPRPANVKLEQHDTNKLANNNEATQRQSDIALQLLSDSINNNNRGRSSNTETNNHNNLPTITNSPVKTTYDESISSINQLATNSAAAKQTIDGQYLAISQPQLQPQRAANNDVPANIKRAFAQYKNGTIITSAGSSPSKYRSPGHYSSSSASASALSSSKTHILSSSHYHYSTIYNLIINCQLDRIVSSWQSIIALFFTCFITIVNILFTRLQMSN